MLSAKANASDLTSRANATHVCAKTAVNDLLSTKTDDSEFIAASNQKANATDVYAIAQANTQLATKTSYTYVDGTLNLKAEKNNVYTQVESLQKFAGTDQMDQALNMLQLTAAVGGHTLDLSSKASQNYVDTELAKKADLTHVNTQLSTISSELDSKVDNFLVTSPLQWQLDPRNALATG